MSATHKARVLANTAGPMPPLCLLTSDELEILSAMHRAYPRGLSIDALTVFVRDVLLRRIVCTGRGLAQDLEDGTDEPTVEDRFLRRVV